MKFSRKKYCKCCPVHKMWGYCDKKRQKLCKATWKTLTKSEKQYLMKELEFYKNKEKMPKANLTYKEIINNNFILGKEIK